MHPRNLLIATFLVTILCSCGGEASEARGGAVNAEPTGVAVAAEPVAAEAQEASVGAVHVEIDGVPSTFEFVAEGDALYMAVASSILARPVSGAAEQFAIRLVQVDLKKLEYPVDLPAPRDHSNPVSLTGSMAAIGFGYMDGKGDEWAGPGIVRIESFSSDGIIRGTFDGVTLPHTDDERPDIVLTNGTFHARISSPW